MPESVIGKATSTTEKRIRDLFSTNLGNIITAFRPLLLEDGLDDDTISHWVQVGCIIMLALQGPLGLRTLMPIVQGVKNELGGEGSVTGFVGWRYTTATRTNTPVEPLLSEPEVDLSRQAYDLYLNRKAGEPLPM